MTNEHDPSFPFTWIDAMGGNNTEQGLTKREYFAAKALQGIFASQMQTGYLLPKVAAERAVQAADELIKRLNENQ